MVDVVHCETLAEDVMEPVTGEEPEGPAGVDSAEVDSAGVDSAVVDSAVVDSAVVDSAVVDSAVVDSAVVDSAVVDSAVVDSAVVDSAVVDSAVVDSAVVASAGVDSVETDWTGVVWIIGVVLPAGEVSPAEVSVTGQTVVRTGMVEVTTVVESAGQFVIVGAQLVMVTSLVVYIVEVVH